MVHPYKKEEYTLLDNLLFSLGKILRRNFNLIMGMLTGIVFALVGFTMAYITFSPNKRLFLQLGIDPLDLLLAICLGISAISGGALVLRYLKPSASMSYGSQTGSNSMRIAIRHEAESIIERLIETKLNQSIGLSKDDKTEILKTISQRLEGDSYKQYISDAVLSLSKSIRERSYSDQFEMTSNRLREELLDLAKRGNIISL